MFFFFFSSRRRHTRSLRDWSSDVCSSDLAVRAIDQGFQKQEIERSAYQVAREIEDGRRVVVGVNRFAVEGDEKYQPLRMDPSIEAEQRSRLAALRAARSAADVRRGLDA